MYIAMDSVASVCKTDLQEWLSWYDKGHKILD